MLFNSFVFIFLFLPIVICVHYFLLRRYKLETVLGFLTISSLCFYTYWHPPYLILLLKVYSKIADHFRRRGVKVTFFAMPYHSATLKKEGPMSKMIKEAQRSLDGLNGNAGGSVLGSFFIEETSCNDNQMMDFMHPNSECVKLIMQ